MRCHPVCADGPNLPPAPALGLLLGANQNKSSQKSLSVTPESLRYQSNQRKEPCRALKDTKAGLLRGTWNVIPNAD